ncbi:MAG TPA: DUF4340 domain-containing protein [Salinivirgaceae bacterium]|nr:DUF4340 domain-containing protein [Salinivirgaceae bacterium]
MLKIKNKILFLIVGILALVVIINTIRNQIRGERTFRSELLKFNPDEVTKILLANHEEHLTFEKISNQWMVSDDKNPKSRADQQAVNNILKDLSLLKIERLVSREKTKLKEFEVDDTLGTKVSLYKDKKLLGELMIGRFSYRQGGYGGVQLSTMVRLPNEIEVYSVEGALSMSVKLDYRSFRDKTIVELEPSIIQQIEFKYPGDSSFTITKMNEMWFSGTDTLETGKVVNYLNDIKNLRAGSFVESPSPREIPFQVIITPKDLPQITVSAFNDNNRYLFVTSQNDAILSDSEYVFKRLFVSKKKFK